MLPSRLTLPRHQPTKRPRLASNRRRSQRANRHSRFRPRRWRRPNPATRRPNSNLWTSCSPKTGFRQQTKTNSRASKRVSLSGFWFASHPPWCQFVHRREYAFSTPCGYSRCGPNTRDPKHRSAYLAVDKLQSSLRGQLASDGIAVVPMPHLAVAIPLSAWNHVVDARGYGLQTGLWISSVPTHPGRRMPGRASTSACGLLGRLTRPRRRSRPSTSGMVTSPILVIETVEIVCRGHPGILAA